MSSETIVHRFRRGLREGFNSTFLTSAVPAGFLVQTGETLVYGVMVGAQGTNPTLTMYDGLNANGDIKVNIDLGATNGSQTDLWLYCRNGLFITIGGAPPSSYMITYI